jgi:hypothetical protein
MPNNSEPALTPAESHYITTKAAEMSQEQVAETLNLPIEVVQKNWPKQETMAMKAMAKKAAGGRKGVMIMTQAASELGEIKPKPPENPNRRLGDCIHKTMGEDYK